MASERTSHLTHLGPTGGKGREREKEKRKRKRELRERSFTLSLNFSAIGPTVSGEARDKVLS